jgi:GTP cyclohydrolase FolE2
MILRDIINKAGTKFKFEEDIKRKIDAKHLVIEKERGNEDTFRFINIDSGFVYSNTIEDSSNILREKVVLIDMVVKTPTFVDITFPITVDIPNGSIHMAQVRRMINEHHTGNPTIDRANDEAVSEACKDAHINLISGTVHKITLRVFSDGSQKVINFE